MTGPHRSRSSAKSPSLHPPPGWLVAAAAFGMVLGGLVPGEAIVEGVTIGWATFWLVLAALLALRQVCVCPAYPWDRIDAIVLVGITWVVLDAFIAGQQSNARAAWNGGWTWAALLAAFVVLRRLFSDPATKRTFLAMMLALAVGNASHGIYQFSVSLPAQRAEYEKATPEQRARMLREAGISVDSYSPTLRQFEDRLRSTEPFAGFGLPNSLAGFLLPWLVFGFFLVESEQPAMGRSWRFIVAVGLLVLCACLVLTKSRSAWLAAILSMPFVLWAGTRKLKERWFIWSGIVGFLLAVVGLGIWSGTLDRPILTEALVSLRYRLEYWRATVNLIGEHPWFGCGPGNFQIYYVQYKLPQASETVADPHQFVLEIASTFGMPGLALAVILAIAVVAKARPSMLRGVSVQTHEPSGPQNRLTVGVLGAILAWLAAPWYGALLDLPAEMEPHLELPVSWCIGLPAAALMLVALRPWIHRGTDQNHWYSVAWLTLAVHLSACGGISYPNVAIGWWCLVAALGPAPAIASEQPAFRSSSAIALLLMLTALGAVWTGYRPVISGLSYLHQAARANRPAQAFALLKKAAEVDPWNPEPWKWSTQLLFERWAVQPIDDHRREWQEALEQAKRRDRRSHPLAEWEGRLALRAYRLHGDQRDLQRAVKAFTRASQLYPNSAFAYAQLAWVTSLVGQPSQAARYAARALQLDACVPHQEWKLAARRLPDPVLESTAGATAPTAEQLMRELLNR